MVGTDFRDILRHDSSGRGYEPPDPHHSARAGRRQLPAGGIADAPSAEPSRVDAAIATLYPEEFQRMLLQKDGTQGELMLLIRNMVTNSRLLTPILDAALTKPNATVKYAKGLDVYRLGLLLDWTARTEEAPAGLSEEELVQYGDHLPLLAALWMRRTPRVGPVVNERIRVLFENIVSAWDKHHVSSDSEPQSVIETSGASDSTPPPEIVLEQPPTGIPLAGLPFEDAIFSRQIAMEYHPYPVTEINLDSQHESEIASALLRAQRQFPDHVIFAYTVLEAMVRGIPYAEDLLDELDSVHFRHEIPTNEELDKLLEKIPKITSGVPLPKGFDGFFVRNAKFLIMRASELNFDSERLTGLARFLREKTLRLYGERADQ